ncbi:MAG: hypothetical protein KJN71_03990 [Acidimicrobiia bacterium]|nr:hypothetical protein [Acidimicrobiia bacterium]NNC74744.1 hypothetical protein [Acidimicrobiia bacterium]
MTWWDRLKGVLKREADDVAEGMREVGRSLDDALARKEREAAATPAERVDMILDEIAEEDQRFDEIAGKVPDADAVGADRPRTRVLFEEDVEATPRLEEARAGITIDPIGADQAMSEVFDFVVTIALGLSNEQLTEIATAVEEHVLVVDTLERTPGEFWVAAPALHKDDVGLLAASAAAQILER